MYKIDLHTHSILSKDGGITKRQYQELLVKGLLDYIAITDHDEVDLALELKEELKPLGFDKRIIVGEEISTKAGEIIGLYLNKRVLPSLELSETIKEIRGQGGLVYVPHPGDIIRMGLNMNELREILNDVDIIEVFNPRFIVPGGNKKVAKLCQYSGKAPAASSDSHGYSELGRTYTIVDKEPTKENLIELLKKAEFKKQYIKALHYLHPVINRVRRYLSMAK